MTYTIHSRKIGKSLTFTRRGDGNIYVDFGDGPGTQGQIICSGGGLMGCTIAYRGDSDRVFEAVCRRWYRAYIRAY